MIPYGRHEILLEDVQSIVDVLRSSWLTTGPKVEEFEAALAEKTAAKHAVVFSSGTAALHAAMYAARISEGDQVILPPITFAATANAVLYQNGTPIFADVDPDKLLLDPEAVEQEITKQTKAIVAVDYAGQPCDYDRLRALADKYGLVLIADACHSLGGAYKDTPVGMLADLNVFSFHPVKAIATGEGGAVTTDNDNYARTMRTFRNHGISTEARERQGWYYEMISLGYNYRLSDIHCALGLSQLRRLDSFIRKRRDIARYYDSAFVGSSFVHPLGKDEHAAHAYHLYVIRVEKRDEVFEKLRQREIGVNTHYIPVYLHPYYKKLGYEKGLCPIAENAYEHILSLPMFPGLKPDELHKVIDEVTSACAL